MKKNISMLREKGALNFKIIFLCLAASLMFIACGSSGGGGDGSTGGGGGGTTTVSGVAAAGAPIVGIVNVKGANGATASSPIELDGSYSIDVTDLAAPYILYAEGAVNGKSIAIYSAAIAAGTINITPITDFILRNALGGQAEDAYNNWDTAQVSEDNLNVAENDVQNQLAPLLTGAGVTFDVDLISTAFNTDQTGMDAVLDALDISYSSTTATVTNNLTGSSYTDDITLVNDGIGLPATDQSETQTALTDREAIDQVWQALVVLYASSIPSTTEITSWFNSNVADDFFEGGANKTQELDDWLSDDGGPGIGLAISVAVLEPIDVTGAPYTKGYSIRLYYSDSTESGNLLTSIAFNGADWLWYGDRKWFDDIGTDSHAFMYVNSLGQTTFQTGFELSVDDDYNYAYNQGVRSAIVTGPGLPTDGVLLEHQFPETWLDIYPSGGSFYPIDDDLLLSTIPDNAEYTYTLCSESAADLYNGTSTCTVLQTYTETNMKPPLLNSELNASLFASLTDPTSHNASDLNFGGEINVSWTNPANADFEWLHLTWWNSSTKYELGADAEGGSTSATIDATGLPAPDGWAGLFIRVEDMYERDFNMGWEFF